MNSFDIITWGLITIGTGIIGLAGALRIGFLIISAGAIVGAAHYLTGATNHSDLLHRLAILLLTIGIMAIVAVLTMNSKLRLQMARKQKRKRQKPHHLSTI